MVPPALEATLEYPRASSHTEGRGIRRTWRAYIKYAGPGFLVALGYMDPGNWATDLAGGARFGGALLGVIFLSNILAMFLQYLALKLGAASGCDLAQACGRQYSEKSRLGLWMISELGMIACGLAEILGAAIAIQMLFGLSPIAAVIAASANMLILLKLQQLGVQKFEAFVVAIMGVVGCCLIVELILSKPHFGEIAAGLIANPLNVPEKAYLACGILGATVMPHNLFLHSAVVRGRGAQTDGEKRAAIRGGTADTIFSLTVATLINAAILILAAAAFYGRGHRELVGLAETYHLLPAALGAGFASVIFGVALWLSSQSAAVTSAMAGEIVLKGFGVLKAPPVRLRFGARLLAVVPAIIVTYASGPAGSANLLVLTQVLLSLQLPFVAIPLLRLTGNRIFMGRFSNTRLTQALGWFVVATIVGSDAALIMSL